MAKKKNNLADAPADLAKKISEKAVDVQSSSGRHIRRYFTRRADRIVGVRRFAIGWLVLAFGLCIVSAAAAWGLYQKSKTDAPAPGGSYVEGMQGEIKNLNPLFASTNAESAAAELMFNGLLRYDTTGELAPDLATSYSVSGGDKVYTVSLKKGVTWHDGQDFSAKDVVFTIRTIQNRTTRSPLNTTWNGINVEAKGENKVVFELPSPSASFAHALTVPILPAHVLSEVEPSTLRSSAFSNNPIGTGPFEMRALREMNRGQQLELSNNEAYFKDAPQVERFVLNVYEDPNDLLSDLKGREITSALDLNDARTSSLKNNNSIQTARYPLRTGVFAFFKTTAKPFNDANVRRALVLGFDSKSVLDIFETRYNPLKTPLLPDQIGFNAKYNQKTSVKQAKNLLDKAGWKVKDGVRTKGSQKLNLQITTLDSDEYKVMAEELQKQWAKIGVSITVQLLSQAELEQTALSAHDYDILLYGISIGADPDVYAYWHSSQAQIGGLNFSEWKNSNADLNLETGRTRLNPALRNARYQAFLQAWQSDAPALALYQPYMNYSYHRNARGFDIFPLNTKSDHLTNVEDWTVETQPVFLTP